jgi:NADPH:quinone reductase-like Zn-dependent oxidoreductase
MELLPFCSTERIYFPDPVASKGEVIVTVEYCGINHPDIWTEQGIAGKNIMLPHICGCDIIGPVKGQLGMVYPGYLVARVLIAKLGVKTSVVSLR